MASVVTVGIREDWAWTQCGGREGSEPELGEKPAHRGRGALRVRPSPRWQLRGVGRSEPPPPVWPGPTPPHPHSSMLTPCLLLLSPHRCRVGLGLVLHSPPPPPSS